MKYCGAVSYLNTLSKFGIRLRLEHTRFLLNSLRVDYDRLKVIHVAGTNGKGSTCMMVNSILQAAGYSVGLYTSPPLCDFTERIVVNNRRIPEKKVVRIVGEIKPLIEKTGSTLGHPTFFEAATAIALKHFCDVGVDYMVLEVGLGGRLDATNVIEKPLISIITNIEYDHTKILGDTIREIALEKAGIIKQNGILVTAAGRKEALNVFRRECARKGARLYHIGTDVKYRSVKSDIRGQVFNLDGIHQKYKNLKIRLIGSHQIANAATAVCAVESLGRYGINIPVKAIRAGLESARWPGRLELMQENPTVIIDGAHNPAGVRSLKGAIENVFPLENYNKTVLVLGILKTKNIPEMVKEIAPTADCVVLTKAGVKDAADPYLIEKEARKYNKNTIVKKKVSDAVKYALSVAGKGDLICITGSLYVVGEARRNWLSKVSF